MRKEDPGQKLDAEQGQNERRFPFLDATYLHTGQTRFSRARKRAGKIPGRKNREEKDKKPARESGEEKRADFPLNAGCREILLGSLRSFSSLSLHLSGPYDQFELRALGSKKSGLISLTFWQP